MDAILNEACPTSTATSNAPGCPPVQLLAFTSSALTNVSSHGRDSLMRSAAALHYPLHLAFLPSKFLGLRRAVAACALANLSATCPDTIAIVVDAYDTFMRCPASEVLRRMERHESKGVHMLLSTELMYSFQHPSAQTFWDERALHNANSTRYRYGNIGGLIGRASAMQLLWRAAAAKPPSDYHLSGLPNRTDLRYVHKLQGTMISANADQKPLMEVVHQDLMQAKNGMGGAHGGAVELDYGREFFHVLVQPDLRGVRLPRDDTGRGGFIPSRITDRILQDDPCLVHVPGPLNRGVVVKLFNSTGPRTRPPLMALGTVPGNEPTFSTWAFCQLCRSWLSRSAMTQNLCLNLVSGGGDAQAQAKLRVALGGRCVAV